MYKHFPTIFHELQRKHGKGNAFLVYESEERWAVKVGGFLDDLILIRKKPINKILYIIRQWISEKWMLIHFDFRK